MPAGIPTVSTDIDSYIRSSRQKVVLNVRKTPGCTAILDVCETPGCTVIYMFEVPECDVIDVC